MEGLSRRDLESLRKAIMLGTARRALVSPPGVASLTAGSRGSSDPVLPLLALVGQHLRFGRLPPAVRQDVPDAALRMHHDARPMLPKHVARLLTRLLDGAAKPLAPTIVRLAKRRIAMAGFRLHPFDLPRLIPFLKGDPDALDPAERAYLLLTEAPDLNRLSERRLGEITAENWTEASKPERRTFLIQQRSHDPGAARALLETVFSSEPAAVRADLLSTLAVSLGPDDAPFLAKASTDRAETVKKVAAGLIARIPSAPYVERLSAAARCFRHEPGATSKLLRLVGVIAPTYLTFEFPNRTSANERWTEVISLFEGLSLPDLATAVGASREAILDALPAEPSIFWSLHARAFADGDAATVTMLTRWRLMRGDKYPVPDTLVRLALASPIPMQYDAAEALFSSTTWTEGLKARFPHSHVSYWPDDGTLVSTAAMLAADAIPAFLAAIASQPPQTTRPAQAFAELVTALDATARPADVQTTKTEETGP